VHVCEANARRQRFTGTWISRRLCNYWRLRCRS
jgi:hypothetical protein